MMEGKKIRKERREGKERKKWREGKTRQDTREEKRRKERQKNGEKESIDELNWLNYKNTNEMQVRRAPGVEV